MKMGKMSFNSALALGLTLFAFFPSLSQISDGNYNVPAAYKWDGREFVLEYNGSVILKLTLVGDQRTEDFSALESEAGDKVEQVFKWVSRGEPLKFSGNVEGSLESFPCEAEKGEDTPVMIKHFVGLSRSILNRAVYDRGFDWLLSVDHPTYVFIEYSKVDTGIISHKIWLQGNDVLLRFRPSFYRIHRGLGYFTPWKYRIWDKSVAGWCSWFAYFDKITEADVRNAADIISETLAPYGLEYLQIDDGYQREPVGAPETWTLPNEKFPSGLSELSSYIRSKGLKPGIWTNVSFHQKDFARAHPEYFVRDENGQPVNGNWIGYVMDGSNQATIDSLVRPVYRTLKETGWEYFKVDALRHLKYEGYNSNIDYYRRNGIDPVLPFRNIVRSIRDEISTENFMMGCWGIRPELVGIIDACRIGDDGFGYGGLAEYNSFNNIVWRNDPDHIELTPADAYKSCMTTSLTGSVFMLTDKPDAYLTDIAEPAKRSLPILFTRPGQVFDVDPSRSALLDRVNSELSGAGPRSLDADQREYCHLYLLEIAKSFERWVVLGRTGGDMEKITFREMGLSPNQEYHVFEFWSKNYLGVFRDGFSFGPINPEYGCQVFCVRSKRPCPQLIATNRHITCGGYELEYVGWTNDGRTKGKLTGKSNLVKDDLYELYIYEPVGYYAWEVSTGKAELIENLKTGAIRKITMRSNKSAGIGWYVNYLRNK